MKKNQFLLASHIFSFYLLKLHQKAIKNPKGTLALFIALFFTSLFGINQLKVLLSIDDLIDTDFKTYPALKEVNQYFKDKNNIILSLESDKPLTAVLACQVQAWLLKISETESQIQKISSTFGPSVALMTGNRLNFKPFLDVPCAPPANNHIDLISPGLAKLQKSPWKHILTTETNSSLTVNFTIKDAENPRFGSIDVLELDRLKRSFKEAFPNPEFRIFWGGVTTYQTYLKEAMDVTQALNGLMFVISLLFFRFFFGSWKIGFLFNSTVLTSLLITYGVMGFAKIPIDVLTNATGLILFASCLEDLIFVAYGMAVDKLTFLKSIRRFIVPAFFTSLTTAVGFASLLTSDLGIIRRIGLVVAFSGMLEWLLIFIFVPTLIKWKKLKINTASLSLFRPNWNWLESFNKKANRLTSCALIGGVLVTLFGVAKLEVKDTPEDFFSQTHVVNTTTAHFLKTRGWVNDVSLLFSDGVSLAQKDQIIEAVKRLPLVKWVEYRKSTVDYISSATPAIKNSVEQMWENSHFSERLVSKQGPERALLYINSMDNKNVSSFRKSLYEICGTYCEFSSSLISYNEFGERVLGTFFESLFTSLVLVGLLLIAIKGALNWKTIGFLLLTSFWGPLALIAFFIIFNIPVFFVSSICAAVLVGLAGDNSIQFIFASRKSNINKSVAGLAYASFLVTFGMALLFSVFLLSPVAPLQKLGMFMILGVILIYIGDVWLLRGLIKK